MKDLIEITIALGGVGKRLNCIKRGYSSKAFLKAGNISLIELLINYLIEVFGQDVKINFAVTEKKQADELLEIEVIRKLKHRVIYNGDRIFDLIFPNKANLLIFCDTFLKCNVIKEMYDNFCITNKSQFSSVKVDNGIDDVVFETDSKNKVINVWKGNQKQEISQIFIFNIEDSNLVYKYNKLGCDRFDIIYNIILPKKDAYVFDYTNICYNINFDQDYKEITKLKKA